MLSNSPLQMITFISMTVFIENISKLLFLVFEISLDADVIEREILFLCSPDFEGKQIICVSNKEKILEIYIKRQSHKMFNGNRTSEFRTWVIFIVFCN